MNSSRGFTLLELLIGMTLLGFILALLFGGFRLAANSWDAVERRVERTNDEQLSRGLMRRLLGQMQPVRWKKATNQPIAFAGERNSLRAIAPLSGQVGVGGLRLIELTLEKADATAPGEAPLRLVLRHAPVDYGVENFGEGLGGAKGHLVLDGLEAVEFSYYGPPKSSEAPQWQETWTNPEQLPQLIRVRLGSSEMGWSDLVVAPMVGGTGCVWSSFYKRCIL